MAFYLSVYPYFQSYLIVVQGESVSVAGRIVQTFTFTSTITGLTTSVLIKYTKRYKRFMMLGSLVYVVGLVMMVRYRTEASSRTTIIGTQILLGIGGGLTTGPVQLAMQAAATHQEVASATTVFLTILEIGGAVGDAISGAIWANNIPQKLASYLPPETQDQAAAIFGNVTLAATGWTMGSPTRTAINRAYQETMQKLLTVAVYVAIPCFILSFFMKNYKLDELDQHVVGTVVGGTSEVADRRPSMVGTITSRRSSVDSDDLDTGFESRQSEQTRALIGRPRRDS